MPPENHLQDQRHTYSDKIYFLLKAHAWPLLANILTQLRAKGEFRKHDVSLPLAAALPTFTSFRALNNVRRGHGQPLRACLSEIDISQVDDGAL